MKAQKTGDLIRQIMDLGTVLVRACVIDDTTLQAALVRQTETKKKLGETLIELGAIDQDQLSEALALQARLRAQGNNVEAMADLLESAQTKVLAQMRRISSR